MPEDEPLTAGRDTAARQPKHDRTPTAHAHALLFLLSLAAHQREPSAGHATKPTTGPLTRSHNKLRIYREPSAGHATKPTTGPLTRSHNKTAYLPSKTVYDRQKLPTDRPPTAHAHSAPRKTALMNRPLPSTVDLLPCGGGLPSPT